MPRPTIPENILLSLISIFKTIKKNKVKIKDLEKRVSKLEKNIKK